VLQPNVNAAISGVNHNCQRTTHHCRTRNNNNLLTAAAILTFTVSEEVVDHPAVPNVLEIQTIERYLQTSTMAEKQDYKFEGWMGLDKESAKGNMVWQEFPNPKVSSVTKSCRQRRS
jgi:hypothetical protein